MNSQERTSGGFRREKRPIPKAWLHAAWLFGMTAALALGWLGTNWIRERVQAGRGSTAVSGSGAQGHPGNRF